MNFKNGDIIEYDDHNYLNKVKLLSDVRVGEYRSRNGTVGYGLHCTKAQHLEGRYAGKLIDLFCISSDCRLSLPFKIGKPIKNHTL